MRLDEIRKISIREFLLQMGIHPERESTTKGMFRSPLREDHHASLSVDYLRNVWYDHGLGKGGGIIDLVALLNRCSVGEAIKQLEESSFSFQGNNTMITTIKEDSKMKIADIKELSNHALLAYLHTRGIHSLLGKHYCKEVHYSINDKQYYAIGFENDSGGYELRNKYFKSCTSKNSTTFKNQHEDCLVFEGFIDFLSYLTLKNIKQLKQDVTVLNSVVNVSKSKEFLTTHKTLYLFLDNDDSGRHAAKIISSFHNNVIDQSKHYSKHKDLNDFLTKNHTTNKKNRGMKR